jgi:hypothetical protein
LNLAKTKVLLLGQPNDLKKIEADTIPPGIKLANEDLNYCYVAKNLGVYFDSSLSWDAHVRNISRTIMGSIYVLNIQRNFIPRDLKPKLVQSLLFPHFYYCDVVYQDTNQNLTQKLQKLQNACLRYACQLRKYDHISPFYVALKWQKLNILRSFHIDSMVFKALNCPNFPVYIKDLFVTVSESHGRSTRSKDSLILKSPKYKLNAFKFSFVCTAVRS